MQGLTAQLAKFRKIATSPNSGMIQRTHKLKREYPKYKKYLSLAKVVSTDKPHVFMHMKEEMGRMQRLTPEFVVGGEELEDTGDNSEDGFLFNVQSYDCDDKQDVFDLFEFVCE